jgi:hypothetical protein
VSSAGIPTDSQDGGDLQAAREALKRHDWQAAYDAADRAAGTAADPLDEATRLDVRAEAAWWLGRMDDCIEARESAFAIFDECGAGRQGAQCAVWLYEHYCFKAQPSIGGAWLRDGPLVGASPVGGVPRIVPGASRVDVAVPR